MTTDLQALIQHLRGGDWNLRAPQEMADMIADKLEAALAAAPSTSPAAAAVAGEPVAIEARPVEGEKPLSRALDEFLFDHPTPSEADFRSLISKHPKWAGDIAEFAGTWFSVAHAPAAPHPSPSAAEQAGRAALAEAHARGLISGLEIGIEQGASSAPSASPAEAPATAVTMHPMESEDGRKGWFVKHPEFYCDIELDAETGRWSVFFRDTSGREGYAEQSAHPQPAEPAGQAAAGVQGEQATGEREAFESWAHASGFNIHRDESDKYKDYHRATTRFARDGWLSALAWYTRSAHPVASPAPAVERGVAEERERERFEAWRLRFPMDVDEGCTIGPVERDDDGEYFDEFTDSAWIGWKAGVGLSTTGKEQA